MGLKLDDLCLHDDILPKIEQLRLAAGQLLSPGEGFRMISV